METEEDEKLCLNCKRRISAKNYLMHTVHCQRNIVLCPTCDEPVPKTEIGNHSQTHVKTNCPKCQKPLEKCDMEDHEKHDCPKRLIACAFCELECAADKMTGHLEYCGSRTEECPKCGQFILLKEKAIHEQMACSPPREATRGRSNETSSVTGVGSARFEGSNLLPTRHGGRDRSRLVEGPYTWHLQAELSDRRASETRNEYGGHLDTSSDEDVETVLLPCEFCGKSFPMDNIILHQSGCELGGGNLLRNNTGTQPQSVSPAGPSVGIVTIPCEFCGESISENDIGLHQAICLQTRNVDEMPSESMDVSTPGVTATTEVPVVTTNRVVIGRSDSVESDVTMLPCEFCEQLFPDQNLPHHQAVCDRNPDMALASDELYPVSRAADLLDSVLRYEDLAPVVRTIPLTSSVPAVQSIDETLSSRINIPRERVSPTPPDASSRTYPLMSNGRPSQQRGGSRQTRQK
ncbi:TRAF-type zinc finger domain-containing protein 1-like [Ornithodoros turicata]